MLSYPIGKTKPPQVQGAWHLRYHTVYPQTITIFQEDDPVYENATLYPNQTYTYGFNTWLDAIDGSYCTYCAYGECGDDPVLDYTYPDPAPGGYKGDDP